MKPAFSLKVASEKLAMYSKTVSEKSTILSNVLSEKLAEPLDAENVEAGLGEIHADISAHFALEERLMREARYQEYEDHKEDHEDLLDQIHDLMDSFYEDPEAGQKLLKTQLSDWFGRHFATFDARVHEQLD